MTTILRMTHRINVKGDTRDEAIVPKTSPPTFSSATTTDEKLAYFHKVDIEEVEEKTNGGDNYG